MDPETQQLLDQVLADLEALSQAPDIDLDTVQQCMDALQSLGDTGATDEGGEVLGEEPPGEAPLEESATDQEPPVAGRGPGYGGGSFDEANAAVRDFRASSGDFPSRRRRGQG